jgi:MFS family permease
MADWPAGRQLALGAALVACGFGGMALTHGRIGIAITVIVWTFGEMVLLPAMAAYVGDIAPEQRSGEYMGLFTMTFGFALVLAPPIGTFLLDRYGGAVLWTAMLGLGLVSAALLTRVAGPAHSR